jgi:hypothetical protein
LKSSKCCGKAVDKQRTGSDQSAEGRWKGSGNTVDTLWCGKAVEMPQRDIGRALDRHCTKNVQVLRHWAWGRQLNGRQILYSKHTQCGGKDSQKKGSGVIKKGSDRQSGTKRQGRYR